MGLGHQTRAKATDSIAQPLYPPPQEKRRENQVYTTFLKLRIIKSRETTSFFFLFSTLISSFLEICWFFLHVKRLISYSHPSGSMIQTYIYNGRCVRCILATRSRTRTQYPWHWAPISKGIEKNQNFFFYPASLYWAYVIFWLRNIYIYIEALHLHPVLEDVLLLSHCRERIEERPYLNERNGPHRTGPFVARIESSTDTRISLSFGRVFPSITTEPCRSSSNGFSLSPKRLQDGGGRLTVESDDAVSFSQLVLGDAPVRSVISRRYVDNGQSQLLLCNKIFRI